MDRNITTEIEKHVQRAMKTHRDFVWLSQEILNSMKEYVSATTLKRLWGHQRDYNHPSLYTLNFLSRYLGYADYNAFQNGDLDNCVSSNILTGCYMTANLTKDDCLRLSWKPDRHMLVRYLDNDQFEVYEACNCKISVGDTFKSQAFVEGETLTLGGLIHENKGPFVYVIGKLGGGKYIPSHYVAQFCKKFGNRLNESRFINNTYTLKE